MEVEKAGSYVKKRKNFQSKKLYCVSEEARVCSKHGKVIKMGIN
jgi:hypothetical protein